MTPSKVTVQATPAVAWFQFAATLLGILAVLLVALGGALINMYARQQTQDEQLKQANLPELMRRIERIQTDVEWLRRNAEQKAHP